MVFNSITFLIFFVVVFLLYWFACGRSNKWQNGLLLLASYFFYGYANLKIVPILLLVTIVFYFLGLGIGRGKEKRAHWYTIIGVVFGVGFLLYFKYFNFFVGSFMNLLNTIGLQTNWHTMKIIMPLGISFFTFKLIAYVLDVRHRKIEPTHDFVTFATYIAFFPCILSGPIDRPVFMKQLAEKRDFKYDQATDGCRQFLWGLFKKVVIADNCATYVDVVWGNIGGNSASTLMLAAFLYAFELYADFSGYSDMAIAVGKWLGLKITDNFKTPFFAVNIADFWRRWHISLTGWMTDYVFMPLNLKLRNWGQWGMIVAIIVNFVIVGLWHGDNWIYAIYGLYHGILFIPLILSGAFFQKAKLTTYEKIDLPVLKDFGRMLLTFLLVVFSFIIFRAGSVASLGEYLNAMFSRSIFQRPYLMTRSYYLPLFVSIFLLIVCEWICRKKNGVIYNMIPQKWIRWTLYIITLLVIVIFSGNEVEYIYFQF